MYCGQNTYIILIYTYICLLLKKERDQCFIIKPLLSDLQSGILFWVTLLLFLVITQCSGLDHYVNVLHGLLLICLLALLLNGFNEILRNFTNKAELNRVAVPPSLQQRRFMMSLTQMGAKAAPLCANVLKTAGAGIGISEIAVPFATGGPNNIGPVTRWATNKIYAENNMAYPINTRLDVMAEHAYSVNEQNIRNGVLTKNPVEKRMYSLTTPSQLGKLGIDPLSK
jgi:hypothetical protein